MAPAKQRDTEIALDLDALEHKNAKAPYKVNVGGKVVEAFDPETMNWEDLAALDSPGDFVDLCFSEEDREHIYDQGLPAFKFKKLWEGYQHHYDLAASRGKRRA
jgi:hypothetical protein